MAIPNLDTDDVRGQFSAYEDPRCKEQPTYHEFAKGFDAWLEAVKAEAEAKGREKAFAEVYDTLDGQVKFMEPLVEETPEGYINESFISGIRHADSAIKAARHLAELPEALVAVAFKAITNDKK